MKMFDSIISRRFLIMNFLISFLSVFGRSQKVLADQRIAEKNWQFSDAIWRTRLSPEVYRILREEGTEKPFSSPLNNEKRIGMYHCAGCDLPLFSSAAKFDSGTGWPSFFEFLPSSVDTKVDFKLLIPRTEYHCIRCGGHQGHVFNDGPRPTGKRFCNNGLAITFKPDN